MWVIYSLLTAFFLATSDALTKRALRSRNEYLVAWARLAFAMPILIATFIFVEIPALDRTFWTATACALPLEITAIILYTKALKVSPISLTMPFLALTPMFLIVTSGLIVGEHVTPAGFAGIIVMALGSYLLNLHRIRHALLEPFRAIGREKGAVLIIIVAFIYSITSALGKLAIEHSSPIFFGSFYFILVAGLFTPVALLKQGGRIPIARSDIRALIPIGITYALMILLHMTAMSLTNVAYMISIKRTSLLFSVIYGHLMFSEERIPERALGAAVMLAGFVILVLGR